MIESDGYIEKKESDGIDFYHESNVTNFCTFYTAQVNRYLFWGVLPKNYDPSWLLPNKSKKKKI